ncbi:MAG: hypothetical protein HS116_24215 [Planctomycetes bacterium]|nr:hypothetical protein [Planctomycetota bacterium]
MLPAAVWLILFVALNVGYSQQAYVKTFEGGYRGGLSLGFPFTLWDEGHFFLADKEKGLLIEAYGGWLFSGLVLNTLVFVLVAWGAGLAGTKYSRFAAARAEAAGAAPAGPVIFAGWTTVSAMGLATVLLTVFNFQVRTEQVSGAPYLTSFEHECGWPAVMWEGRDRFQRGSGDAPMPETVVEVDRDVFEAQYAPRRHMGIRVSSWKHRGMVVNLLFGAFLVMAAGGASEWWRKRRQARAEAASVSPAA